MTVVGAAALGPVTPRPGPPPPGWSADGPRRTVPRAERRGPEHVWGDGARRVRDGQAVTRTARAQPGGGGARGDRHPGQPHAPAGPRRAGPAPAPPAGRQPRRRVPAPPAGGLAAALPPRRPGRRRRHEAAQQARQALGLGPPAPAAPPPPPTVGVLELRNDASAMPAAGTALATASTRCDHTPLSREIR